MESVGIALRGLEKRFGEVAAVAGVHIEVPPGAFLALLGPSGCGKTTILRMLAGLEDPTGGEIAFGERVVASGQRGTVVPPGERNVGLVFQSYALWPHMRVKDNIAWPLKVQKWDSATIARRVQEVLALLSIDHLADRYPHQLSGGQQQRVAIARTLAPRPRVLLFDEPLSNLDAKLRAEMRTELLRVHRASGATSVYVTHDQVEAMTMASHVAVMRNGQVEQFGAPGDLLRIPSTPFVATFVGTPPANLVAAQQVNGRYCYKSVDLGESNGVQSPLLMYRPEQLRLANGPGPRCLSVEFAEATPVAGRVIVTVWDERQRINIVTDQLPSYRLGDSLYIEFPAQPDAIFGQDEQTLAMGIVPTLA
ncbi:MAG: ABC transporter ATP-binding protein [Chloroflexaceae bacterium]|jgi:iron(III) transport system ATP-binding protein|nr:ABC transporter ATP-binding protein [Chloroflexaceae bacterium]